MAISVILPKQGLDMKEATIIKWLKKEGERVDKDEPLFSMETDKACIVVSAPARGTVVKVLKQEGETALVAEVIAIIAEPGEDFAASIAK